MNGVIYARFSSHNQREESIDAQVRACEDYARKNGINIIKVYKDEALSATSDKRPSFQTMIRDVESKLKTFDVILIHKLDRFARDKYDSVIYKRRLKNSNIKLISVTANIDGSPEGIILESLLEGMAQYYSANLAREVMKGLSENALKCKHTGGKPPFGYNVDDNNCYVINEHEAIAVREAFRRYANGESYTSILQYLSDNGYKTKYNNPFQKTSLFGVFHNEKYKGTYVYNQYQRIKENGVYKDIQHENEDVIRIDNGVPAIVDVQTWETVQKKMEDNKLNYYRQKAGRLMCDWKSPKVYHLPRNYRIFVILQFLDS